MPVSLDQCGAISTTRLQGDIDISAALELKNTLLKALASATELHVELADAIAFDITTFQLLWAAERAAGKAGLSFSIGGPVPEEIALAMDHAGLEKFQVASR